jgi:hypothetical protein
VQIRFNFRHDERKRVSFCGSIIQLHSKDKRKMIKSDKCMLYGEKWWDKRPVPIRSFSLCSRLRELVEETHDQHAMIKSRDSRSGDRVQWNLNLSPSAYHHSQPALMSDPAYGFTSAFYLCSRSNSTRPPLTLPFNSPPSLSRGVRSRTAPLYGLGWRSSYAKILCRHPVDCLASVSEEAIIPLWVERGYMDRFDGCVFRLHSTRTYRRPT